MVVYLITNLINGKKYIGMDTKNNPNYLGSGSLIIKAIKKYGRKNFKKEILETCSTITELEKRETYWIDYFNALNDKKFYNLADVRKRGKNPFENKTAEELKIIFDKIKNEERNKKIGKANSKPKPEGFGEKVSKIHIGMKHSEESKLKQSIKLKGRTSPNKGKTWTPEQKYKIGKPILQYDLEGNFIKEWPTSQEAKKELKIKGITECLKNRAKTSGGYIWKYKNN
jgi:group I intron endonuclease